MHASGSVCSVHSAQQVPGGVHSWESWAHASRSASGTHSPEEDGPHQPQNSVDAHVPHELNDEQKSEQENAPRLSERGAEAVPNALSVGTSMKCRSEV